MVCLIDYYLRKTHGIYSCFYLWTTDKLLMTVGHTPYFLNLHFPLSVRTVSVVEVFYISVCNLLLLRLDHKYYIWCSIFYRHFLYICFACWMLQLWFYCIMPCVSNFLFCVWKNVCLTCTYCSACDNNNSTWNLLSKVFCEISNCDDSMWCSTCNL